MAVFDDFLPCPALDRWLLPSWDGQAVGAWICAPRPRWKPPRALRRLLARGGIAELGAEPLPASLDVLVVVSPLSEAVVELEDAAWQALRAGGTLVDLATPERRAVGEVLRPWAHSQRLREAAAGRVRLWLERGAFGPEQWITTAPAGVVVTMVDKAVLPGRVLEPT